MMTTHDNNEDDDDNDNKDDDDEDEDDEDGRRPRTTTWTAPPTAAMSNCSWGAMGMGMTRRHNPPAPLQTRAGGAGGGVCSVLSDDRPPPHSKCERGAFLLCIFINLV